VKRHVRKRTTTTHLGPPRTLAVRTFVNCTSGTFPIHSDVISARQSGLSVCPGELTREDRRVSTIREFII
jgi:hypothetical protein